MDGVYRPIPVEQLAEDTLQGHSDVLDLDIRWHDGRLEWYDPETGRHIVTLDDERAARIQAESRAEMAQGARTRARGGAAASARQIGSATSTVTPPLEHFWQKQPHDLSLQEHRPPAGLRPLALGKGHVAGAVTIIGTVPLAFRTSVAEGIRCPG